MRRDPVYSRALVHLTRCSRGLPLRVVRATKSLHHPCLPGTLVSRFFLMASTRVIGRCPRSEINRGMIIPALFVFGGVRSKPIQAPTSECYGSPGLRHPATF